MAVKVLFLHSGDNWIRGSETALLNVLRNLDRQKVEPFLLCDHAILGDLARREGIETTVYRIPQIMFDGGHIRLQFAQWAAMLRKVLSIMSSRQIQLLYSNGGRPCQVAYYAGKMRKIPVVCHVHCAYNRRYILLYRFHRSSKVIFVSRAIEESTHRKQHFLAPTEVVYNGIDTQLFRPACKRDPQLRQQLSLPADAVVFGQVSSMIHGKGIDILLRAFQVVIQNRPHARLVLVGDGPQHQDYLAMANRLGIAEKVLFTGYRIDPLPFYQHVFDVNVLCSRREALGYSLLEGAACGLPCLATDVDGIPEVVLDQQTGMLFPLENHAALAQKMVSLISDCTLRRRMGQAARELALDRFSKEKYLQSVERIILERADQSIRN